MSSSYVRVRNCDNQGRRRRRTERQSNHWKERHSVIRMLYMLYNVLYVL